MISRIAIFLVINFAALGLGSLFTSNGVRSEWYINLAKAPWTPPGWVFGFAWTSIMICFSVYMACTWQSTTDRQLLILLFALQWILNVSWNPAFFKFHQSLLALAIIISLTFLVGFFLINYYAAIKNWSILVLPYFIWLILATSLNAFIVLNNSPK